MLRGEIKGTGIILRLRRAQEADVVVRILTSKGELISAFAKAGLKSQKRFGGALEALNYIQFRATLRGDEQTLALLEEVQFKSDFGNLKKDYEILTGAASMAKLVDRGAREGLENPEVFNLFGAALRALDVLAKAKSLNDATKTEVTDENHNGILRQFEIKLLSILGWLPGFEKCESCGSTQNLSLSTETGHVVCQDCGHYAVEVSPEVQKAVRQGLETSILQGGLAPQDAKRLEKLLTPLLKHLR